MDPKTYNSPIRQLITTLENSKRTMERLINRLTIPDWFFLANSHGKIKDDILRSNRVEQYRKLRTFNLDTFPDMIGVEEIDCLANTFPEVEKIVVGLANCDDGLLDNLQNLHSLKKIRFYMSASDLNCNYENLEIKSLSLKSKFKKSEFDPFFYLLLQFNSIETFSMTEGYLSKNTIKRLEGYKLTKLKLIDTHIDGNLCIPLVNMIKKNKELKNLTLISKDFTSNPYTVIVMSEIISSLPEIGSWDIEELKFTLDQSCKIKYKYLKKLKCLRKIYVFYNVQEDIGALGRLVDVILSMPNIRVTFREYVIPFPSHSGDLEDLFLTFQCLSEVCASHLESLGNNVEVFPLKY